MIANNKTAREDTGAVNDSASKVEIREATNRGELLIDKKCLLSFPLNDPHTPKEVRENYLLQEELMMSKFLETLMSEWNEE